MGLSITGTPGVSGIVRQFAAPLGITPMISKWNTALPGSTNSNQIQLPLEFLSTPLTVDWGDGITEVVTNAADPKTLHTYTTPGIYEIKYLAGTAVSRMSNSPLGGDQRKIIEISQWGTIPKGGFERGFSGANNLVITATDPTGIGGDINAFMISNRAMTGDLTIDLSQATIASSAIRDFRALGKLTAQLQSATNITQICRDSRFSSIELFLSGACTVTGNPFQNNVVYLNELLLHGLRVGFSIANANLNASALNNLYTSLGTAAGAQTITVTGNPGVSGHNPSIATSKGWNVVV